MVRLKRQKVRSRKDRDVAKANLKIFFKVLIAVILVGSIGYAFVNIRHLFLETDYFIVKAIEVKVVNNKGELLRTDRLKELADIKIEGMNIFSVDLEDLRNAITETYPEYKNVIVRRIMPNRLIARVELRKAVAQVHLDRYYLVDDEGVFTGDVKNLPESGIPVISGLGSGLTKINISYLKGPARDRLNNALFIIKGMSEIKGLSGYNLKMVDLSDPGNLSLFLEGSDIEIKIGNSDFKERLETLSALLAQLGKELKKFKYIDLRFEDPIVSPR